MGFQSLVFHRVFREANGVIHRLAHLVSFSMEDFVSVDETLVMTQDVLFEDCNVTRNLVSLSSRVLLFSQ